MTIQIRQDLVDEGVEFIQTYDNRFLSQKEIQSSTYLSTTDDGIVSIELANGDVIQIDSVDVDFINESVA
jgi:hypothetical protein